MREFATVTFAIGFFFWHPQSFQIFNVSGSTPDTHTMSGQVSIQPQSHPLEQHSQGGAFLPRDSHGIQTKMP